MKTEFKTDINGLYLEITPENDNERRLMGELMNDPMRGRRVKMGVRHTTDQRGNQVVRIQGYRYLSNFLELTSRIKIIPHEFQNGLIIMVDNMKWFAIKTKQPTSSSAGTVMGTVKVWELIGFAGNLGNVVDLVKDPEWKWKTEINATGALNWLGTCHTENEFLAALGIK